jgi:hypothetical protein
MKRAKALRRIMPRIQVLFVTIAMLFWSHPVDAGDKTPAPVNVARVDLELLLAVDVSSSVSPAEYTLQVQGLAKALRDPAVQLAVRRAGRHGVAVAVVQWGGDIDQVVALDWVRLNSPAEIDRFAERVSRMPRIFNSDDTRIGSAVLFSASELTRNRFLSPRLVIDVSGDGGVENMGITRWARDRTIAKGITINGLAIENEVINLEGFFRDNVIGGLGAFVIRAAGYNDFADAMRRKLIREIGDKPVALKANIDAL